MDNYLVAKPLLEKYENTCHLFFIATGNIDSNNEFWWDELEHILFSSYMHFCTDSLNRYKPKIDISSENELSETLRRKHET